MYLQATSREDGKKITTGEKTSIVKEFTEMEMEEWILTTSDCVGLSEARSGRRI